MKYIKLFENNILDKYKISEQELLKLLDNNSDINRLDDKDLELLYRYMDTNIKNSNENEICIYLDNGTEEVYYIPFTYIILNKTELCLIKDDDDYYYVIIYNERTENNYHVIDTYKLDQKKEFIIFLKIYFNK